MPQEPQPAPEPNGKPPNTALTVLPPAGTQWERELEPRNLEAARVISKFLHESRLFSAYGSPQAVFSIILAGRELGLGTMASLRAFHVVEGKPSMAADFLRSLVLASGKAEYFRISERTTERATWTTKRVGDPEPVTLTYTLDEAKTAGLVRPNSGWTKHVADMLAKTASSKLARLMYPDVCFGLYSAAELGGDEL